MKDFTSYAFASGDDADQMAKHAQLFLKAGWVIHGYPVVLNGRICQAFKQPIEASMKDMLEEAKSEMKRMQRRKDSK